MRRASRSRLPARLLLAITALFVACQARGPAVSAELSGPDADAIRWEARHALENGRALRAEGRTEAAERVLRRVLVHDPENVKLLRELANVLDAEGRAGEARAARAHADAIDPPPSPPMAIGQRPCASDDAEPLLLPPV